MSDISDVVAAQGQTVNGILGLILESVGLGVNVKQQEKNRELQLQLVREQNQAAAEEAEKAYQRSKATTQVNNMRAAGMSQAGAVNVLNGGGSYTPAPVNVADVEPTQVDTSGIVSALQNIGQLKLAERQLQEQKRQFNLEYDLRKEESRATVKLINEQVIDTITNYTGKEIDNAIKGIEYRISNATQNQRISAEQAEYIARDASAILSALKNFKQTDAWSKMTAEEIAEYYKLQAKLEVLSHLGNTKATDILAKVMSIMK